MRTIDADALTASLKKSADICRDWIQECINIKDDVTQRVAEQSLLTFTECYLRIEKMPTIEPQRMRGRWIGCGNSDHWKCSVCGTRAAFWFSEETSSEWEWDMSEWLSDFCPNCGSYNGGEQDVNH